RLFRVGQSKADALYRRAFVVPEIQAQTALYVQRLGKHALTGHHAATTNIVGTAVGENGYVVALGQKTECNGHASLASAHNSNFTHDFFPSEGAKDATAAASWFFLFSQFGNGGYTLLWAHGRVAAIHGVISTGHETGGIREQEGHDFPHFLG